MSDKQTLFDIVDRELDIKRKELEEQTLIKIGKSDANPSSQQCLVIFQEVKVEIQALEVAKDIIQAIIQKKLEG